MLVGSALRRAGRLLSGHRVTTDLPPDLPLLRLDFHLPSRSLLNLLENAARTRRAAQHRRRVAGRAGARR